MALPEGVTTCTVTAGVPVTHTGAPVKAFVSIEPSVFLVHTATGTPLVDFLEELSINEGVAGQFTLPHTDQAGFQDENGNAYTNWYYTARISYSTPSKAKTKAPKIKVFQLAAGQTLVDLDALPGGAPALPYTAPIAVPTSFNGRTGAITLQDSDLPERLSDESLTATYATAAALTGKLDKTEAAATYVKPTGFGRAILLGDSTDLGTTGDGVPGKWIDYLTVLSNARVRLIRNAGIGGNTTTQMLARIQTDVIAYNPDICIIGGPTNDHSQGISEATTRQNFKDMVAALRMAGITPVVRNCWPSDTAGSSAPWNTVALRRKAIQRHNYWLKVWADSEGIPVLDVYTPTVDVATGGFKAGFTNGVDGVHPLHTAYLAAAQSIVAAGLPSVFPAAPKLPAVVGDDAFVPFNSGAADYLFLTDATADGVADGWNLSAAGTGSLVTGDTAIAGNWQRVSSANTTGGYSIDARTTNFVLGHRYAFMCRVKATTGGFRLRAAVWGGDSSPDFGTLTAPVEGIAYIEAVASGAGTTTLRLIAAAPTTGVAPDFRIAQAGIVDLTALGIAP